MCHKREKTLSIVRLKKKERRNYRRYLKMNGAVWANLIENEIESESIAQLLCLLKMIIVVFSQAWA